MADSGVDRVDSTIQPFGRVGGKLSAPVDDLKQELC